MAPRWVVGVGGVGSNTVCSATARKAAGSDLQPLACVPLRIPTRQLVLMPKLAGPDRDAAEAFAAPDFAQALPAAWRRDFGTFAADHAVVQVSLGGGLGDGDPRDPEWQAALSGYLANSGLRSAFLGSWDVDNANNGGLLAPDGNPRTDKLQLLRRAWGMTPVRNHASPVVTFEVKQGSAWKSLQKMDDNHFLGQRRGNQPLSIRITDSRGKRVVDTSVSLLAVARGISHL